MADRTSQQAPGAPPKMRDSCCCDPPETPMQTKGECYCCGAADGEPCRHSNPEPAPSPAEQTTPGAVTLDLDDPVDLLGAYEGSIDPPTHEGACPTVRLNAEDFATALAGVRSLRARLEESERQRDAARARVRDYEETTFGAKVVDVLRDARGRAVAAEARASAAERRISTCEAACSMPLEMISTTLDAHRATAQADHEAAEAAEAALADLREKAAEVLRWHVEAGSLGAAMAALRSALPASRDEGKGEG